MGMTNFHLIHKSDGWHLTQEGNPETVQQYSGETKAQAVELASEYVRAQDEPGSLKIHREDGTFEEERTFPRAEDPRESPG